MMSYSWVIRVEEAIVARWKEASTLIRVRAT